MLRTELLEAFEELPPELRGPLLKVVKAIERTVGDSVKREDFLELKAVVADLAQAQRKTEEKLRELAEAQRRTEERLDQLAQRVDQLTQRVDQLTQRLDQLTQRVDQLAEAQRKTEKALEKLAESHAETRGRLESMSDAVGYELENRSFRALPALLKRDLGVEVEGRLLRRYVPGPDGRRYIQVNIYGWGRKEGEKVLILGEAKTSLSKREVNKFMRHVKLVSSLEGIDEGHIIIVGVVHTVTPDVEEYARDKGIKLYWSYDI